MTLGQFSTNAGSQVDLKDYVSPANAQLPDNIIWYIGDNYYEPGDYSNYATIEGSTITALMPYLSEGVNQPIPYGVVINGGNYSPLFINGE